MSAIKPNKNFYDVQQQHVSYQDNIMKKLKEVYTNGIPPINQETQKRFRTGEVKNKESAKKWFGL